MISSTKINKSKRPKSVGKSCRFPNNKNVFGYMRVQDDGGAPAYPARVGAARPGDYTPITTGSAGIKTPENGQQLYEFVPEYDALNH